MSEPTTFTVPLNITGRHREVEVRLYETVNEMRDAIAARYVEDGSLGDVDFSEAGGFCYSLIHTFEGETIDRGTKGTDLAAIIFLHRDQIGTNTVVHEAAHAAACVYSLDMIFGKGDALESLAMDHLHGGNEELAYLTGDIASAIVDALYDIGAYTKDVVAA